MATGTKSHQATVEDYFSDDGHGNGVCIDAFTSDHSPGKANVRTKRSNPGDLGTDKTPTGKVPNNCDVKSDSGYSSQSVAGMSSADSAASATSSQRSPPVVAAKTVPAAPSPTPAQRAPRPPHQRQQSTQSTQSTQSAQGPPRQPLSRRDSQASRRPPAAERRPTITHPAPKRRDSRNVDDCTIPGCTQCGPDATEARPRQPRRQSMLHTQPAESAPDVSYPHPYDTRSQVSDPAQYQASSPREHRAPRMYHTQGGPVVQPAISRRLSVNTRRPTSYHGDSNHNWAQPGMHSSHPSPPQEYGPPLSRSAVYGNMPYGQPPMPSPHMPQYPPQNPPPPAFYQAQQMQPMYDQQRPPLQARAPASSGYGHPIPPVVQVARSDRHMPSARYHPNPPPPQPSVQRRQPHPEYHNQGGYDDSVSESESETESEADYEPEYRLPAPRTIMAPPDSRSQRNASKRRPSLLHANTTPAPPAPKPRRPQTVIVPERDDSRARDRNHDSRADRRASVSRPPLVPLVKSHSAYDSPQARVIIEGSRSSRRESLQAYDRTFKEHRSARQQEYNEQRRPKRSSRVYDNVAVSHDYERDFNDDEEEDEPVARASLRRRETGTESRRRAQRPVEVKQAADAEDYISAKRGDRETYADQTYEIAKKRSSRTSAGPSEAESSRSKGSDNGEIRLRIGNDAPVTLSLNGDMEGRTLQLVPIENGMNELVISGNSRGGESVYRSERGSTRGDRRAIMPASQPRREAEEMTERSSQSSRRKREPRVEQIEPRRLLHRQPRKGERREHEYRY